MVQEWVFSKIPHICFSGFLTCRILCLNICQLFFNSCLQKQSPHVFYKGFKEKTRRVQNTFKLTLVKILVFKHIKGTLDNLKLEHLFQCLPLLVVGSCSDDGTVLLSANFSRSCCRTWKENMITIQEVVTPVQFLTNLRPSHKRT